MGGCATAPPSVGQLMRSQQAAAQLRVGVLRKRVRFHQVGDEANRRLRQGVETAEEPAPLIGDVAQLEHPLALANQARGFAILNGVSLTALLFAGGASSCCWSSMLRALSLGHHM
jgi:hypothetical protein